VVSDVFIRFVCNMNLDIRIIHLQLTNSLPNIDEWLMLRRATRISQKAKGKKASSGLKVERKQAEATLPDPESRYRILFENANDALYFLDAEGGFLDVNNVACERLGYGREELLKMTIKDVISAGSAASIPRYSKEVRERGQVVFEAQEIRRDGSIVPVEVSIRGILHKGKPAVLGISRDITERREIEKHLERLVKERTQRLAESESRLRLITDSLPALISYVDADLIYRFNNKAYEDWFSKSSNEIIGRHIRDVVGEATYQRTLPRLNASLAGKTQSYDYELPHTLLGTRFVTATYVPDFGANGQVRGVFVLAVDVTDRKRAENALRESEHRYSELFQASPVSLWEEDFSEVKLYFDGLRSRGVKNLRQYLTGHPEDIANCASMVKIRNVNQATLGLYGAKSVEELLGELGRVLTHESQAEFRFREELVALGDGKTRFASEFDNQTLTGDVKHVSLILTVVPGYEKTLGRILVSIVDLTDWKEMEQRLQQSERLAAIGQMAAMVGHDLRNPLQAITGATYLLKDETLTPEERNETFRLIEGSLQHANELVSELLEYSREIHLALVEVTPKELTRNALDAVTVPETIRVQDQSQEKPTLLADLERMRRVFINLITNAIDAMPNGGTLTISSKESNGFVELVVADTGTGLDKQILENLWKPLQTTKTKGIGLGLPIVKRIVDAHNATIWVCSKTGVGTTVTIRLPLKPEEGTSESEGLSP